MNTDRELLDLAAKAIGGTFDHGTDCITMDGIDYEQWNPLTDDGDALRLAVKLDISWRRSAWRMGHIVTGYHCGMYEFWEPVGNDDLAATRRAIVLSAAGIGKAMP